MKNRLSEKQQIWNKIELRPMNDVQAEAGRVFFPEQLKYVLTNSNFYRNKYKHISYNKLSDWNEILKDLPFTSKSELLEDQVNNPPFGSNICVAKSEILRVHKTSGTTGRPLMLTFTHEDLAHTIEAGVRCFWSSGLRPEHMVIHCLNYRLWAGGCTDHQSLEATGASVVPYGVGKSNNLIETILWLKPDAIHCTPSYLTKLENVLKSEYGIVPLDLGLKLGLFGAEGGLEDPNFRQEIENKWGMTAMNANYGMSDILSMFGAECSQKNGLHFMGQGIILVEIVDTVKSTNLPVEKGVMGELVLTNLRKKAQPLVRYRTHDLIEILDDSNCECGRHGFRFKVVGRSDDMIVVKGINVFPAAIATIINKHLDTFTGEYLILIDRKNPVRRFIVKVEIKNEVVENQGLYSMVMEEMTHNLMITAELEFVSAGALPKVEGKSNRIQRVL